MDKGIIINNEEYLVVKEITLDNRHYLYAVSTESNKYTVLEQTETPEGSRIKSINDKEEIDRILTEMGK
jgi:hypothetical protein